MEEYTGNRTTTGTPKYYSNWDETKMLISPTPNAALNIEEDNIGEEVLSKAILAPFQKILDNGGLESTTIPAKQGVGIDVVTGNMVHMIDEGIIDPLLVTKSALRNAASVASTIISTDCVINNVRVDESSR